LAPYDRPGGDALSATGAPWTAVEVLVRTFEERFVGVVACMACVFFA
jgi:hypothetical protein